MELSVELESEGRWVPIGELARLPGVVGFGATRVEAPAAVEEIALQMLADEWIEYAMQSRQGRPPVLILVER